MSNNKNFVVKNGLDVGKDITANNVTANAFTGDVTGDITSNGTSTFTNVDINGGTIDGVVIGGNAAGNITGNTITGTSLVGPLTGNADTASTLATPRTISLGGDLSGSASFDGSTNITITSAVADDSHNHVIANVDGLQTSLDSKLDSSDIGSSVLAYDSNLQSFVNTFTLPVADGTADQVLKTDGIGNLSFVDQGGGGGLTQEQIDILTLLQDDSAYFYTSIGDLYDKGKPKGPFDSIQINSGGDFKGYSSLTFDSNNNTLSVEKLETSQTITSTGNITTSGDLIATNFNSNGGNLNVTGNTTISGDLSVTNLSASGTVNGYSIDAIHDRGQLNSSDSAYFYTKITELEESNLGLKLIAKETINTLVDAVDLLLPTDYSRFLVIGNGLSNEFGSTNINSQISTDGGNTFISSSYAEYGQYTEYGFGTVTSPSSRTLSAFINHGMPGFSLNSNHSFVSTYIVDDSAVSLVTRGATDRTYFRGGGHLITTSRANAIRIKYVTDGIATGTISLYGYKESI